MAGGLRRLLPFSASTTPLQATTYLLGISLFSISFLVFLNSAVSFLVTDLLGIRTNVGDIVGTLGFVDEIVALIACPVWGLVSDRLGVRWVAVLGYAVIGIALFAFVQARNVWPGLVLVRIVFAIGATAAATMVTAILPVLTDSGNQEDEEEDDEHSGAWGDVIRRSQRGRKPVPPNQRNSMLSVESDVTITPERYSGAASASSSSDGENEHDRVQEEEEDEAGKKPSALAGYVGLFTGCGALVALALFLPLPTRFAAGEGVTPAQAITSSFYVVGAVAFAVAIFVFFGLAGLKGEEGKGWRMLLGLRQRQPEHQWEPRYPDEVLNGRASYGAPREPLPYRRLLLSSLRLGVTDPHIALGYLGGFVARASSVAISLFIPLYINTYFMSRGFCQGSPHDSSPELKRECSAAYVLSSILSGVAQLVALLCAPLFGYLSARRWRCFGRRGASLNLPIQVAAACGVVGYCIFPSLTSPEFKDIDGRGGGPGVFLVAALLGISQIGAIVCSLGSLGRGVLTADLGAAGAGSGSAPARAIRGHNDDDHDGLDQHRRLGETSALLERGGPHHGGEPAISRVELKGSVAGVYSWCGGAAILLLTKLGGYLFDAASVGAPFYMMAAFNAMLLVASLTIDLARGWRGGRIAASRWWLGGGTA